MTAWLPTPGIEMLVIAKNTPKLPSTTHNAHNANRKNKNVGIGRNPRSIERRYPNKS